MDSVKIFAPNAGTNPISKEIEKAYKEWLKTGELTQEYMRLILGDPMKSVSAFRIKNSQQEPKGTL